MIVDMHNHVGLSIDGVEGKIEDLVSIMDENDILASALFSINSSDAGSTYEDPNDRVAAICEQYPKRFFGICRVQPKVGTRAIQELERCMEKGFKGLKLHPHSDHFFIDDCLELFKATSDMKCPLVILHTEHHATRQPMYWQGVFEKYKEVNFILAHSGKDLFMQAGELAKDLSNVYLDTSTLSYNRTKYLLQEAGPQKMVFASDYPYSHPAVEKKKLELILSDPKDLKIVFEDNPKKLLNL